MENTLTMLHHEEPESSTTPTSPDAGVPAAQVRVTAEEFARAVARHQARREEAAQKLEGTVSLGDAVQELNIDITPEELLAEVQAARAEQQAVGAAPQGRRRPRLGVLVASVGLLTILSGGLWEMRGMRAAVSPTAIVDAPAPQTPPPVSVAAPGTTLVQDNSGKGPVLRTLQEIRDGVPVRCDLTVTEGRATFTNFSSPGSAWTLIKHDGQVYVRGWIPDMSMQAIRATGVTLYGQKEMVPSGAAPRAVSLRLDGLQCAPGQQDDEMIVAQKVQPDGHFGDLW